MKKSGSSKLLFFLAFVCIAAGIFMMMNNNAPDEPEEVIEENTTYYEPVFSTFTDNWSVQNNAQQQIEEEPEVEEEKTEGIRDKYTKIKGNNKDKVTIMVYMCGSDLEAQGGMATYDLSEMASADLSPNVNLIVYTGGCTKWHVDGISTKYNQVYQVVGNGKIGCISDNAGTSSILDPENLTAFIEFCEENYEADRYELIFWDHGSGSVGGYGYDAKNPRSGSMTLDKIDEALTDADVYFDFIGFDACLMATTENALMLSKHADYLIASEESEPGIGWYYTDWLNSLSKNTSLPTVQIGKVIADSFVSKCAHDVPGQAATLSVIDLAELEALVPKKLAAFAKETSDLINDGQFKQVSKARGSSRDFGSDANMDMVDLVDLTKKLGTEEGEALREALLKCIKYNNVSRNMTNSYGLSIFFPYRSTKYVNTVLSTYKNIKMDSSYSDCIRNFASYQTSGQITGGGSHNAYQSFDFYDSSYGSSVNSDDMMDILSLFLGGGYTSEPSYDNYYSDDYSWLFDSGIFGRSHADYLAENHFDADLNWKDGKISLTPDQWSLVNDLKLNVFIDDGTGYIDLGKDNIYDIDDKGNLLKQEGLTWVAASVDNENWQIVPYYYSYAFYDGESTAYYGRIPAKVNDELRNLLVKIDDDGMEVVGAVYDYPDSCMVAKSFTELNPGDEITFVCDFYDYDGNFSDVYTLGDSLTVDTKLYLGDADISDYETLVSYQFTDIYNQNYWSAAMK